MMFSAAVPVNSSSAGGELFEKFQRQKLNRESGGSATSNGSSSNG